jgi:hypothetical protein
MAGDEIGMQVRKEDVGDAEIVLSGKCQVLLDVALRVDDGGDSGLFVSDEIRGMRKAVEIKLLENHWISFVLLARCGSNV